MIAQSIVLFCFAFKSALAVNCYFCNSAHDETCADPFDFSMAASKGFLVDCDQFATKNDVRNSRNEPIQFTHCRKLTQTVLDTFRVVRSCATYDPKKNERVVSATDYYKKIDLTCKGDECNGSLKMSSTHWMLGLVTIGLVATII